MQSTVAHAMMSSLHTHLYPHSIISLSFQVLSQDGSLLACLINAATLALVDAGIPMHDYVVACTAGSTLAGLESHDVSSTKDAAQVGGADPLLDLNHQEEQELPYATIATLGSSDRVVVLVCESRLRVDRLEGVLAVGLDGCKRVREILDSIVREKGERIIADAAGLKGEMSASTAMDIGAEA